MREARSEKGTAPSRLGERGLPLVPGPGGGCRLRRNCGTNVADPSERPVKRRGGFTLVRDLHPVGRGYQQSGQRPRMLWVHDFEMHFPVVGRHDDFAVVQRDGSGGRIP